MRGCKIGNAILGLIVVILALAPSILGGASKWVLFAIGLLMIIHSMKCNCWGSCENCMVEEKKTKSRRR